MKQILKAIIGLVIVQGAFGKAPKMFWADDCPDWCKKCLEVKFESGEKDTACLTQMYNENECLFQGNFMGTATRFGQVVVSSSQCLKNGGMDDVQVSFMDDRSPGMAMFEANTKIGTCSAEFNSHMPNEAVMKMKYPHINNSSLEYRMKDISMRQIPAFPTNGFKLNLALRYDINFANHFGGASENTVQNIMAHSQNHFTWDSLDANMCLNIQSIQPYNGKLDGDGDLDADLDALGLDIISNEQEDANLFVYISYFKPVGSESYIAGIAWTSTVCYGDDWSINDGSNNGKGFRSSISLWTQGDLETAEIVSHEIGHNLGMKHDFTDPNPGSDRFCETNPSENCANTGGIMDYYQPTTLKWTCCSNSDFLKMYQQYQPFCLAAATATCGGTSPTVGPTTKPPTQPPTTKPPAGCGVPNYVGDGLCDDGNNNEECNYDNGDCCPPHQFDNWDEYCTECECKEGGDEECEDEASAKYCKKMNTKKCKKSKFYKKCRKTCNKCGPEECEDAKSSKYCNKMKKKGKCDSKKIAKKCQKTCDAC